MTNAERFRSIFGIYATELWAMSEPEFLEWLNVENELTQINDSNTLNALTPRWIPMSERLPKKHDNYLVTVTGKSFGKKYKRVEVGQWLGDTFWIGWYEPEKKMLAWMPLPEPYQEGEQNG